MQDVLLGLEEERTADVWHLVDLQDMSLETRRDVDAFVKAVTKSTGQETAKGHFLRGAGRLSPRQTSETVKVIAFSSCCAIQHAMRSDHPDSVPEIGHHWVWTI